MKTKIRDGYVTCPGCGYEFQIGTFEICKAVSLEAGVIQVKPYKDIEIYQVYCPDCGLPFYALCGFHHTTKIIYK
ncbi:MAG: hypothetical protein RTU30_11590 [Candidatus Thorarchaeota archaeon]